MTLHSDAEALLKTVTDDGQAHALTTAILALVRERLLSDLTVTQAEFVYDEQAKSDGYGPCDFTALKTALNAALDAVEESDAIT